MKELSRVEMEQINGGDVDWWTIGAIAAGLVDPALGISVKFVQALYNNGNGIGNNWPLASD
jgi:hypothetical protein